MNKKLLVSAALTAAMLAAPAMAQEATGYIGAAYGNTEVDTPLGDFDGDAWGIEGAVAFDASESIGIQLDASYVDSDDLNSDAFTGTAHVFTRNDEWAVGGFVGATDVDGDTAWNVGVEGAKYFEQFTLAGSVSYGTLDDVDVDVWGANLEGRFFATDNLRFDGRIGAFNADAGGLDIDGMSFGVGAEWQIEQAPVSLYTTYDSVQLDDVDVDVNTWMVGVRWNFGGSLKDRDRNGASFNGGLGSVFRSF